MLLKPIPRTYLVENGGFDLSCYRQFDRVLEPAELSLKYVLSGEERYELAGKTYTVRSGSFLVVNKETQVRGVLDSKTDVYGLCMAFPSALIEDVVSFAAPEIDKRSFLAYLRSPDFFNNVYGPTMSLLSPYLKNMAERLSGDEAAPMELYLQAAELLLHQQTETYTELRSISSKRIRTQKDIYSRLLIAKAFIEDNLHSTITVDEAAAAGHFSVYHFYRLFRSAFGLSPYQYLLKRRIELSVRLLREGLSIADAGLRSGFNDVHSFSKSFKKQTGLSPLQFLARG